jgi:DNA-binding beta-propeller fold protein YncE
MEVIKKIPLKDRLLDFHLDENAEIIYIRDYPKNLISILDCKTSKIIKEISIEKPHDIALNPKSNRLLVPSGSRGLVNKINPSISIIDTVSHEIIDLIEYKEEKIPGFILRCNSETNSFYFENKGNLSLIHGDDYSLEKSIIENQKIHHFEIDQNKNILYCINKKANSILIFDGSNYELRKTIPINLSGASIWKLLLNPHKNLIYLWYVWGSEGGTSRFYMDVLDTEGNILVKDKKFGFVDNVTISISSGNVYVTKSNRSEIYKFDYLLQNTLEMLQIKKLKGFRDKLLKGSDFWNPVFDSKHDKIYVGDGKELLIIKD